MSVKQSVRKREAEGENKVSGIEELILKLCCANFCSHFLHESIGVGDKHCVQSLHGNTTAVNHSQCTVWSKPTLAAFISCAQRFVLLLNLINLLFVSSAKANYDGLCMSPASQQTISGLIWLPTFKLVVVSPLLMVTNDEMFDDWFILEDELVKPKRIWTWLDKS